MSQDGCTTILDGPHRRRSLLMPRLFHPVVYKVLIGGAGVALLAVVVDLF